LDTICIIVPPVVYKVHVCTYFGHNLYYSTTCCL